MSRGGVMLESSQCGGCGTLGNGGATLPRWMSSQFGVRRALQHWNPKDGTQFGCAPSRVCVGPLSARCRVEDPSLHVWPPNTCHTPVTACHSHTAASKKTELPPYRIVGDQTELLPPRIEMLANRAKKRIKKMKLCRQGADWLYAILKDTLRNFCRQ